MRIQTGIKRKSKANLIFNIYFEKNNKLSIVNIKNIKNKFRI